VTRVRDRGRGYSGLVGPAHPSSGGMRWMASSRPVTMTWSTLAYGSWKHSQVVSPNAPGARTSTACVERRRHSRNANHSKRFQRGHHSATIRPSATGVPQEDHPGGTVMIMESEDTGSFRNVRLRFPPAERHPPKQRQPCDSERSCPTNESKRRRRSAQDR